MQIRPPIKGVKAGGGFLAAAGDRKRESKNRNETILDELNEPQPQEEEEEEDDDEVAGPATDALEEDHLETAEDVQMREFFPMSFGKAEKKIVKPLESLHDETKRASAGAPKPKGKKGKPAMSFGTIAPIQSANRDAAADPSANQSAAADVECEGIARRAAPPAPPKAKELGGEILSSELEISGAGEGGSAQVSGHALPPSVNKKAADHSMEVLGPVQYTPAAAASGRAEAPEAGPDTADVAGPPRPPAGDDEGGGSGQSDDDSEDDDAAEEEAEDPYRVPMANEISLKGHKKAVSALAVDHSGSRLISGSHDYNVRLYDFNGMKRDLQPFRKMDVPCGDHQIVALSFSPSGHKFLVVPGSAKPKIFDRDGREEGEFIRGDMYIRDQKNTKGHTMGCTGGQWHPTEHGEAMTCSLDGTIRLWDVEKFGSQKSVLKPAQLRAGRVPVTACTYSPDGRLLAGGLGDGSVQIWSASGKMASAAVGQVLPPKAQLHHQNNWSYSKSPKHVLRQAHESGEEITCIRFSADNQTMLTRCSDHSLKVWDMRKLKAPLKVFEGLHNNYGQTQVAWSPDETLFFTGVSCERDGSGGALVFFERASLQMVKRVGMPGSPVVFNWQPRINQIFVGCGDAKSGSTQVLYDPTMSERGAMQVLGRAPRVKDPVDVNIKPVIHNPHALPMFREDFHNNMKRKRDDGKDMSDPKTTKKPEQPLSGPGVGGRMGTTGGTLLTQYLMKERGMIKETWMEEDMREAFLKHQATGEFTTAYNETQPDPVFRAPTPEEDELNN